MYIGPNLQKRAFFHEIQICFILIICNHKWRHPVVSIKYVCVLCPNLWEWRNLAIRIEYAFLLVRTRGSMRILKEYSKFALIQLFATTNGKILQFELNTCLLVRTCENVHILTEYNKFALIQLCATTKGEILQFRLNCIWSTGPNLRERVHLNVIKQIRFNLFICNCEWQNSAVWIVRVSVSLNLQERAYLDGIQRIRFTLAVCNYKWQNAAF